MAAPDLFGGVVPEPVEQLGRANEIGEEQSHDTARAALRPTHDGNSGTSREANVGEQGPRLPDPEVVPGPSGRNPVEVGPQSNQKTCPDLHLYRGRGGT
jgi:hypothetical protein